DRQTTTVCDCILEQRRPMREPSQGRRVRDDDARKPHDDCPREQNPLAAWRHGERRQPPDDERGPTAAAEREVEGCRDSGRGGRGEATADQASLIGNDPKAEEEDDRRQAAKTVP